MTPNLFDLDLLWKLDELPSEQKSFIRRVNCLAFQLEI